jgi:AbrB family looped-hinge helix DNA binding protein
MQAKLDSVGRVVIPKPLRDALGLSPGATVEIAQYGAGIQITAGMRTAKIVQEQGMPVVSGETEITDEVLFDLIDRGRR